MLCLSQYGETALMVVSWKNYVDCARLLVDAGADKDVKNSKVRIDIR